MNPFSCSTPNDTNLGGEVSRVGGQHRVGSPCVNQEILRPICHIQVHPWLQLCDGYLWQVGWLEWATSVLLNHHEGRFNAWPWGCGVLRAEWHSVYQLMAFEASHLETCHSLDTVWPNVLPFYKLHTCFLLCPSRIKVCYRASLEGSQDLGMPCLFPYLPFLGLGLPLLFCYKRDWWLSGPLYQKKHQGSCCCSCCNFILISKAHCGRNLYFKITCA